MNESKINFEGCSDLEKWFLEQDEKEFPSYEPSKGELSYKERYTSLVKVLEPYHSIVEKGAMVQSYDSFTNQIKEHISNSDIDSLVQIMNKDPAIYLNQHGKGHINKVIQKAGEMISFFNTDPLNASEVFILLCAIQIHDIGNIFGREGHERSFQTEFRKIVENIIPDTPTQKCILKIASVHGGKINGSKDTITESKLRIDGSLFNKSIRETVLAALLRFADELADDYSRGDLTALKLERISKESVIFHEYSKALHSVKISKNEYTKTCYISLEYYVDAETLVKKFKKNGEDALLIDEIFERTKKMEKERRYCMRFLFPYIPLTEIKVRIEISPSYDLIDSEVIEYTLKEEGYPLDEIEINCENNSSDKILELLKSKGWID